MEQVHRWKNGRAFALGLMAVAVVALAVRFTMRDAWLLMGIVFYACPLIIIGLLFLLAAWLWLRCRQRPAAALCIMAAIACGAGWVRAVRCTAANPPTADDSVRVLLWNAGMPMEDDVGPAVESVLKHAPDVVVLVESGELSNLVDDHGMLPADYQVSNPAENVTVLAKGGISNLSLRHVWRKTRIARCTVTLATNALNLMVVDMDSSPVISRRLAMEEIIRQVENNPPDIIAGDFNTPIDSVLFAALRKDYVQAFEQSGNGMLVTWPSCLPILAIDHIWVRKSRPVLSSRMVTTFKSDHRMFVAEIALLEDNTNHDAESN